MNGSNLREAYKGKEVYDAKREEFLCSLGLKVYRISVDDIKQRMDAVLGKLEEFIVGNYGV